MRAQRFLSAVCVVIVMCAAACGRRSEPTPVQSTTLGTNVRPAAEGIAAHLADGWITTKVQAQFFSAQRINAMNINVSTRDGVVTLEGKVDDPTAHSEAVEIARHTEGVRDVQDRLTVAPTQNASTTPQNAVDSGLIAAKIEAQYFGNPYLKGKDIQVSANDGVVTVTGRVDTPEQRQQAIAIAQNTNGVARVEDKVVVQPQGAVATSGTSSAPAGRDQGAPDDSRITTMIQARFFVDSLVKSRPIDVHVSEGVVTLRGEVSSEAERQQALRLATTTEGVKQVEDDLHVAPPASASAADTRFPAAGAADTRSPATGRVDDEIIATKIQSKYFADAQVSSGAVSVACKDGVALLQGTVPTQAARKQALEIARNTEGVVQVIDRLTVTAPKRR